MVFNCRVVKIGNRYGVKEIPLVHFMARVELSIKLKSSIPKIVSDSNFDTFPLRDRKLFVKLFPRNIQKEVEKFLQIR